MILYWKRKSDWEVIKIDTFVIKDRQESCMTLSGTDFITKKQVTVTSETVDDIEDLQIKYEAKYDKPVPARYKNDSDWIISKL